MLLQFRICIEKYPYIQVKFLSTNLFLCDFRVRKRDSEFNLGCGFWPHPIQAAHARPDKNYVQIQKNCISLGVYNKINCSIPS